MQEREPDLDRIERQAVAWQVKLRRTCLGARERAAFDRWLAADPRHRAAFERMSRLWLRLGAPARRLGAGGWYRARPAHRASPGLALRLVPGAGLAAAIVVALLLWRDPGLADRVSADAASAPGSQRQVVLTDRSRVTLDGDSAIDVRIGTDRRDVWLRRGRAWFEVEPDAAVPFHVSAGGFDVRVTGTAFAVERPEATGGTFAVVVAEGSVVVTGADIGPAIALRAGQALEITSGGAAVQAVDADTRVAWRRGLIVFDRASLKTAAAELGRITGRRFVILDAGLETMTLSGVFRRDDPAAVLAALTRTMGIASTTVPGIATFIHR